MNGFGCLTRDHPDNKWGSMYRVMNEERIGVMLLQETHLTESRKTEKEGVAIVLNKKLVSVEGLEVKEVVKGRAIQVKMTWCSGEEKRILCLYAPTSEGQSEGSDFFKQLSSFYEQIDNTEAPHIVAGDFNNVEAPIDRFPDIVRADDRLLDELGLLKQWLGLQPVDGWRRANPTKRDFTFTRGKGDQLTRARLDRIYVKESEAIWMRDWRITPAGVKTDHLMVMVEASAPDTPVVGKGRPVFPTYLLKDAKLKAQMKASSKRAADRVKDIEKRGRTKEDNAQKVLVEMKREWLDLARAREKAVVPRLLKEIRTREEELEAAKADLPRGCTNEMEETARMTEQIAALKAKRYKQQQVKLAAKHRALGESTTKYWMGLNKDKKPRALIPSLRTGRVLPNGEYEYERDPKKMAEVAKCHYDSVQEDRENAVSGDAREVAIEEALRHLTARVPEQHKEEMQRVLEYEDCELAIHHAKPGTAPGLDGIQYEVWKVMHARFIEDRRHEGRECADVLMILTEALRDVQRHGVEAGTGFAEGWIIPVYKEKGDLTEIVNYRPITLLNTDYKILTKVMAMQLAAAAPEIISPAQAGFVKGRKLKNHTQLIKLMASWAETEEINGAIIALDQEKAYDRISHDYLWRTMKAVGIPDGFINTTRALYADTTTSVAVNGLTSEKWKVYRGVRQGDPLSCLLFNLAIEPLAAMIRSADFAGLKVPETRESLKAILFADDTTAFLSENDDFRALQRVIDVWCSASKARFNITKTEILPIGSAEHRARMTTTYRQTGEWMEYPRGAKIAGDGEPVRILGAHLGNNVNQRLIWRANLEKLRTALERWKKGRATITGKALVMQMMAGGVTQFLASVQRMPEEAVKEANAMIRKYIWDDNEHAPIAMKWLYKPVERGGLGLLDLEARNEAIDIVWLRDYLTTGPERPLWVNVVEAMLAKHVCKNLGPGENDIRNRINPFMQHWKPKMTGLQEDLKAMIRVASKYGLRMEGLAFDSSILRAVPMWSTAKTDKAKIRKLSRNSRVTRCLTNNHEAIYVGDFERIAALPEDPGHDGTSNCVCQGCEQLITMERCANPAKCAAKAAEFLDLLPSRWDPRTQLPEIHDAELAVDAEKEEAEEEGRDKFDRSIVTKGSVGATFRIFTEEPQHEEDRIDMTWSPNGTTLMVATDGACERNGEEDAVAGAGVYTRLKEGDVELEMAARLPAGVEQTNQTGELYALWLAASKIDKETAVEATLDSKTTHQQSAPSFQLT
ncbi:hypothetical protein ACG7TL_005462 [Trametes sanguinea]